MGHAAYQRGSVRLAHDADLQTQAINRRLDAKGEPLNWDQDRAALVARAEAAERQLERATLRIRLLGATLTAERAAHREELERLNRRALSYAKAMLRFKARWDWVSRLVRTYLTPDQVQEFRDSQETR